ncbi:MAG: hypothetical protein ACFNUM_06185, partial [Segatella salivae]
MVQEFTELQGVMGR